MARAGRIGGSGRRLALIGSHLFALDQASKVEQSVDIDRVISSYGGSGDPEDEV
jgi:hypothetical protein